MPDSEWVGLSEKLGDLLPGLVSVAEFCHTYLYRHADRRYPFLWEIAVGKPSVVIPDLIRDPPT